MEDSQSAHEIQSQLEAVRQQQVALEQALEQRRKDEKQGFVDELRQMILDRGYQPGEIGDLLSRGKRKRAPNRAGSGNYTRYVDPDNPDNIYLRGRMPNWLTEKMTTNGFDPENAEQRQQFKDQHLTKVTA